MIYLKPGNLLKRRQQALVQARVERVEALVDRRLSASGWTRALHRHQRARPPPGCPAPPRRSTPRPPRPGWRSRPRPAGVDLASQRAGHDAQPQRRMDEAARGAHLAPLGSRPRPAFRPGCGSGRPPPRGAARARSLAPCCRVSPKKTPRALRFQLGLRSPAKKGRHTSPRAPAGECPARATRSSKERDAMLAAARRPALNRSRSQESATPPLLIAPPTSQWPRVDGVAPAAPGRVQHGLAGDQAQRPAGAHHQGGLPGQHRPGPQAGVDRVRAAQHQRRAGEQPHLRRQVRVLQARGISVGPARRGSCSSRTPASAREVGFQARVCVFISPCPAAIE